MDSGGEAPAWAEDTGGREMEGQWADLMTSFDALAGWTMASIQCEASEEGRDGRSRGEGWG